MFNTDFNINNVLWHDVETAGEAEHYYKLPFRKKMLWEKKCDKLMVLPQFENYSYEDLWQEKCSLTHEFAKIICITVGMIDANNKVNIKSFSGDDEQVLLLAANECFNKCKPNSFIGGFNIKRYDIPIMCKRMVMYGIKPATILYVMGQKPWEGRVVDLAEIWQFNDRDFTTLDTLTCVLNLDSPKDVIEGKDVHKAYYAGRLPEIVAYCEKDVASTIKVCQKFVDLV